MAIGFSAAWKVALAVALAGLIVVSFRAQAPRRRVQGTELRRLIATALMLYAVGALGSVTHRSVVAALSYAGGICMCALAAWLSRGSDSEDGPGGGDDPVDEQPPPGPDGARAFDWDAFEREFRSYAERTPAAR